LANRNALKVTQDRFRSDSERLIGAVEQALESSRTEKQSDREEELILSDILMPEGDGTTLLHDIRRDPKLKSTPVVLMTESPDVVTPRQDMKDQRADDFMLKPVSLQTLLGCVQLRVRSPLN
jgi:CheY-like chemotaxis protein